MFKHSVKREKRAEGMWGGGGVGRRGMIARCNDDKIIAAALRSASEEDDQAIHYRTVPCVSAREADR